MTEIMEIFNTLMEQFGTLAWWYALGALVMVWLTIIMIVIMMIEVIKGLRN